jgi:hypothetical protein
MNVYPLRSFALPDIGDYLIHFTGRTGGRVSEVPDTICEQDAAARLRSILLSGRIQAFPQFGAPLPVSCFTESVPSSVLSLIREARYTPHAVGFAKQFIFARGGGPVWYVRGDQWRSAHGNLSQEHRSMTVRYWPGAEPSEGETLSSDLLGPSEWLQEREWRLIGDTSFSSLNVAFVIVPTSGWLSMLAVELENAGAKEEAAYWWTVPEVVIDSGGTVHRDPVGFFGR